MAEDPFARQLLPEAEKANFAGPIKEVTLQAPDQFMRFVGHYEKQHFISLMDH
jgi:hypothetical protein